MMANNVDCMYCHENSQKLLRWISQGSLNAKESACNVGRHRFNSWVGKIPWRRKWQPTSVFLPGEFLGDRSLAGPSPWSHKESDTNVQLTHTHTHTNYKQRSFWINYSNQNFIGREKINMANYEIKRKTYTNFWRGS